MSKWIHCLDCDEYFPEEEAETVREYHHEIDGYFYENVMRCPCCKGVELEDAYECEMCGEPTLTEVCEGCEEELKRDFDKFLETESKYFNNCDKETLKSILYMYLEN